MTTILAAIFVFGILVTVHELGHFLTAKLTGMRVDEFAVGFGPPILQKKRGETLYSLRAVPLGGYNKIAGMDPEEGNIPNGFSSKSLPARMLVILSGALMNFILPIVLFFLVFTLSGIDKPLNQNVLGDIIPGKPAAVAGLQKGDRILTIDGATITTFDGIVAELAKHPKEEVAIAVERGGETLSYKLTAEYNQELNRPLIGVYPQFSKERLGPIEGAGMAITYTKAIMVAMVDGLAKIVTGKAPADASGPIGVAQMAGRVADQGIIPLLNFVALLSINLGIMNLLPIPALDGGHFIILCVEGLRGKPLSAKITGYVQMLGFSIIMAIMVLATFMDLSK